MPKIFDVVEADSYKNNLPEVQENTELNHPGNTCPIVQEDAKTSQSRTQSRDPLEIPANVSPVIGQNRNPALFEGEPSCEVFDGGNLYLGPQEIPSSGGSLMLLSLALTPVCTNYILSWWAAFLHPERYEKLFFQPPSSPMRGEVRRFVNP
jgi:hypothetical protein